MRIARSPLGHEAYSQPTYRSQELSDFGALRDSLHDSLDEEHKIVKRKPVMGNGAWNPHNVAHMVSPRGSVRACLCLSLTHSQTHTLCLSIYIYMLES